MSTFVCPFPVPRQNISTPWDLNNGIDYNNQSLWDDSPIYVDVLTLFCLFGVTSGRLRKHFIKMFLQKCTYLSYFTKNDYTCFSINHYIDHLCYVKWTKKIYLRWDISIISSSFFLPKFFTCQISDTVSGKTKKLHRWKAFERRCVKRVLSAVTSSLHQKSSNKWLDKQ